MARLLLNRETLKRFLAIAACLLLAEPSRAVPAAPAALSAPPAPAPPAPDPVLAGLIEQSLAARPELARAELLVRAERERVPQAGALPDPMLQVGLQNEGLSRVDEVQLMASQSFPWPGTRDLRREVVELGAAATEAANARLRLATEAEVRGHYLELLLVRDRRALLDQLELVWQKSLGVARVRYEAGGGAQSDVLRAQLELHRIGLRRTALQAEERARVQALNRLRVQPLDTAIDTTMRVRDLPAPASLDAVFVPARATDRSPELAAARLGVTRGQRESTLAEKAAYPELTVGGGVMVRGMMPPMWLVTLGSTLPIYGETKTERAVAEAGLRTRAIEQEIAALEQLVRLRSAERRTAAQALTETIDLYARGLLVQSQATTESTLSQFQVGRVSFASVLEANAGFIADQEGDLAARAALQRLVIAEETVSLDAVPMPSGGGGGGGSMAGTAGVMDSAPAARMGGSPAPVEAGPAGAAMGGM